MIAILALNIFINTLGGSVQMNNNFMIDFVKQFFNSMPDDELRAKFKDMGIEEDNIDKLMNMIKEE